MEKLRIIGVEFPRRPSSPWALVEGLESGSVPQVTLDRVGRQARHLLVTWFWSEALSEGQRLANRASTVS